MTRENFPSRKEFGLAVTGHLRKTTAVAHAKDSEELRTWMARQAPREVNQTIKYKWPEDKLQATTELSG